MFNTYKKESINRICSIAAVASAFLGIIAYFLPFVSFFVSFNYFELVENVGGYIPVACSVAAFVLALFLSKNKGSFAIVYLCGAADFLAFVIVLAEMNQGDFISGSDVSAAGYVLFLIAHIVTFIACLIYRFFGEHSGETIISKGKSSPQRAYNFEGSSAGKPPKEITDPKYEMIGGSGEKVCPSCGKIIDDDAVFCQFCGFDTRHNGVDRVHSAERSARRSELRENENTNPLASNTTRTTPSHSEKLVAESFPAITERAPKARGFSAPDDLD